MTFFAMMCNFMEMVYRPWGSTLRIHKVLGSLKLIGVEKNIQPVLNYLFPC